MGRDPVSPDSVAAIGKMSGGGGEDSPEYRAADQGAGHGWTGLSICSQRGRSSSLAPPAGSSRPHPVVFSASSRQLLWAVINGGHLRPPKIKQSSSVLFDKRADLQGCFENFLIES